MRADGTKMKGLSPFVLTIPYIMPKRYDAQNMAKELVDEDVVRAFIHARRKAGHRVTHMSVLIAAYYKALQENPMLNCFVVNRKIYKRNHFCVTFVMVKLRPDGSQDETTIKIFVQKEDTVYTLAERIEEEIHKNAEPAEANRTDKFAAMAFAVPGLARVVFGLARFLDYHGLLPRSVIDLSPFHTSLFITNLASINHQYIYHHTYEFGTTSVFICMGRPEMQSTEAGKNRVMPLGIVMDERICTGIEYVRFSEAFRYYIKHPEELETPMGIPE